MDSHSDFGSLSTLTRRVHFFRIQCSHQPTTTALRLSWTEIIGHRWYHRCPIISVQASIHRCKIISIHRSQRRSRLCPMQQRPLTWPRYDVREVYKEIDRLLNGNPSKNFHRVEDHASMDRTVYRTREFQGELQCQRVQRWRERLAAEACATGRGTVKKQELIA